MNLPKFTEGMRSLVICLTLLLTSYICLAQSDHVPGELTPNEAQLARSDNSFGFKLFKELASQEDPNSNVIISPLSVAMALTMTLNGAEGKTKEAMLSTLEVDGMSIPQINQSCHSLNSHLTHLDTSVVFNPAHSLWIRQGFTLEEPFLNLNGRYFDAEVAELDFDNPESVDIINGWVRSKTNGKIEEILDTIPPLTVLYLINAIYFNGVWSIRFEPENTHEAQFTLSDDSVVMCDMMIMRNARFPYFSDSTMGFQAIDLPYGDGQFSMTIVLPDIDRSLDSLIANLSMQDWVDWMGRFRSVELSLLLPKFKLEYGKLLNDQLKVLGMEIAFSGNADFSGINRDGGLYISRVIHKTFIEVNEEGTEAAAATIVEISKGAHSIDKLTFDASRPFLFVIRDRNSGAILFLGKVMNPVES